MNPNQLTDASARRQFLLGQMSAADSALRTCLHRHNLCNAAREHLERALAHIRESYVCIAEAREIRSVAQLVEDLNRIEQAFNELRQQPPPGVTVKSFRP